jgi:uncharacterized protein
MPKWLKTSDKEKELTKALLAQTKGKANKLLKKLLSDKEISAYQSYANNVSITRLGFNDHGPVHMRLATITALTILDFLRQAGVKTSLEKEGVGSFEDSKIVVIFGAFFHDLGMCVTRQNHEWHSKQIADEFIVKYLKYLYPKNIAMRCALRGMCHEALVGHMGNERINSIEAGIVLVADGADMSKGRSRIPQQLSGDPQVGSLHMFSASSIERVNIIKGENKPVHIEIVMEDMAGTFQVEEVFMTKVKASPILPYLEISVRVGKGEPKFYLR